MDNNLKKSVRLLPWLMLPCFAAQADYNENFLVGIDGGYAWRDGNLKVETRRTTDNLISSRGSFGHDDDGAIFGVFGGFQFLCNQWLVGLELNLGWQDFGGQHHFNTTFSGSTIVGYTEHERDYVFNGSFRFGYQLTDWMLGYTRFGVEMSRDTLKGSISIDGSPSIAVSDKHRSVRYVVGAGAEFPVPTMSNLSFRLEYNYSKADGAFAMGNITILGVGSSVHAKVDPHQHAVKAALVWNFI